MRNHNLNIIVGAVYASRKERFRQSRLRLVVDIGKESIREWERRYKELAPGPCVMFFEGRPGWPRVTTLHAFRQWAGSMVATKIKVIKDLKPYQLYLKHNPTVRSKCVEDFMIERLRSSVLSLDDFTVN